MHLNRLVYRNHIKSSFSGSISLISFLLFSVGTASAQHGSKLTLADALRVAKENNIAIQKQQLETQIAREEISEKKELRLPEVEFHSLYSRITDLTEFKSGFLQDKQVTKTIPEIYDVSASFRMPLYAGNRINNAVKKAGHESEIALLKAEKTENDVRLSVIASFLGIYKMMELQKIITQSIQEEQERLKEVKSFKTHGTVTKNEVLRAELQLSDRELNALTNQKNTAIALHNLKTLLQLPEDETIALDTMHIIAALPAAENYDHYLKGALRNEEMKIAQQEIAIGNLERKIVKANYYPTISFFGNYSFKYPNYMFFPPNPYLYSLGQIGVEATFNLSGLYKNKTRMHIADKKVEVQKVTAALVKNEMSDKVFKEYTQYHEILDRLPVTDKALELAEENYRIVKLKYLNQLVLITEMIDADNTLLEARFKKIATRIDAAMKYYELLHTADMLHE